MVHRGPGRKVLPAVHGGPAPTEGLRGRLRAGNPGPASLSSFALRPTSAPRRPRWTGPSETRWSTVDRPLRGPVVHGGPALPRHSSGMKLVRGGPAPPQDPSEIPMVHRGPARSIFLAI